MSEQDTTEKIVIDKKQPCEVEFVSGEQTYKGTSMHFNDRGILVTCKSPAPLNSKGKLTLQFHGLKNLIEVNGEVVWTNIHGPVDSFSPKGMAIKYMNIDRDAERLLADIARQYETMGSIYSCYFS